MKEIIYKDETYYEIAKSLGVKPSVYFVSKNGNIYSTMSNKILTPTPNRDGYLYINLQTPDCKTSKISMAKIVLTTFNGEPPITIKDPTTEHINGNRQDNRCDNLMWMERIENASTRNNTGKGELNSRALLTEKQVHAICTILETTKATNKQISEIFDVKIGTISSIRQRRNWTCISDQYDF